MTESDYKINKGLSYVWLVVAIGAVLGAFLKGAWHQLFIAGIATLMFFVMRPKKWIHIPDEAYTDLNDQIQNAITDMEDESKTILVETEVDGASVSLAIELNAKVTNYTFYDDAWGYRKKFTETNFYCSVEIVGMKVIDENDREVDSDFDEDYIQAEYESTDWK